MKFLEFVKLIYKEEVSRSSIINQSEIIEEKDNRGKILKMGVPQDVADFLHNLHDKYSLWFADKIKNLPGFQQSNNKLNFVNNLRTQMQGIVDWVTNTPNIILKQYDWNTALEAADQYHKNLTIANIEGIERNTIIKQYNDGFYWVDLESTSDNEEGSAMGHCANTHKGETLYSLRRFDKVTNTTEPFVTLAISPDKGQWVQCKGKQNSKPKKVYFPYIADILIFKNCYTFETEYDARNDFTDKDLEEYVEEHQDEYDNADEILEKIRADRVNYEDFEKVLEEYKFKHYSIDLDEGGSQVNVRYGFYIEIDYKDTGVDKATIDDEFELKSYLGRKLLSDVIEGYPSDLSIHPSYNDGENSFFIRVDIEAETSESFFELSDDGLRSFEKQCDYFKRLDTDFDKEEFINDTLPKLLELDGVVTSDLSIFADKVKAKFPNIRVEREAKTLDLNIRFGQISTNLKEQDLSSSSWLRRGNNISLNSQHEDLLNDRYNGINNDINLYIMFWEFINNHLLDNYKTLFAGFTVFNGIDLSAKYYFEDADTKYNFDREFEHISRLINEMPSIAKYLTTYEEKIVIPFCRSGEPITLKDIVKPNINESSYTVNIYNKNDVYIGYIRFGHGMPRTMDQAKILIQELIDSKKNLYEYRKINSSKIYDFLDELVNRKLSFKDFFEGYMTLNKII